MRTITNPRSASTESSRGRDKLRSGCLPVAGLVSIPTFVNKKSRRKRRQFLRASCAGRQLVLESGGKRRFRCPNFNLGLVAVLVLDSVRASPCPHPDLRRRRDGCRIGATRTATTQSLVPTRPRFHGTGIPGRSAELFTGHHSFRLQTAASRRRFRAENGPRTLPEG